MCPPTHPRAIIVRLGSELERSRELESGRELAGLHKDTKPIIRKQRQVYIELAVEGIVHIALLGSKWVVL